MPFLYADGDYPDSAMKLPDVVLESWRKLAITTGQGDPVCCAPVWNLAYHAMAQPRAPIFYQSAPQGLLLFVELALPPFETILAPLENGWMFGSPLLGIAALRMFAACMPIFEKKYYPAFPQIEISGVREDSISAHALYFGFKNNFDFYRVGSSTQCAASLAGGVDGWMSRRSANHRAKLKKAARKCREAGITFERHRPATPEAAMEIFSRMLAVEENSWKGIGHCGMTEKISTDFYSGLISRLALWKSAYVIMASREGRDVGFIFGGACGPIYRGQQFSYSEEVKSLSLGNVLQLEKIKWLCELGFARYDMGPVTGPRMEYKKHWTEIEATIQTWRMRKRV